MAIAFNDVDLWVRLWQAGWRIVWTPTVELYHHESASTGQHDAAHRIERFRSEVGYMRRQWNETLDRDSIMRTYPSSAKSPWLLAQVVVAILAAVWSL